MLIQRHDVGARAGEECTYRRHQSRSIGTPQQEPTHILGWQTPTTCARVLLLHLLQGVTPARPRSRNLHILRSGSPRDVRRRLRRRGVRASARPRRSRRAHRHETGDSSSHRVNRCSFATRAAIEVGAGLQRCVEHKTEFRSLIRLTAKRGTNF
jgi:hypothetical protein